jgi:hypothetical protein
VTSKRLFKFCVANWPPLDVAMAVPLRDGRSYLEVCSRQHFRTSSLAHASRTAHQLCQEGVRLSRRPHRRLHWSAGRLCTHTHTHTQIVIRHQYEACDPGRLLGP